MTLSNWWQKPVELVGEGLNIIKHAGVGLKAHVAVAETTPLRHPDHCKHDIDVAHAAEVWRRGSVVVSWMLDLTPARYEKIQTSKTSRGAFRILAKAARHCRRPSTKHTGTGNLGGIVHPL